MLFEAFSNSGMVFFTHETDIVSIFLIISNAPFVNSKAWLTIGKLEKVSYGSNGIDVEFGDDGFVVAAEKRGVSRFSGWVTIDGIYRASAPPPGVILPDDEADVPRY